ncbi:MAG: rhomboid family intramembrane serine protease [Alphaproteobacteria bacterium]|nr:rhomboid family intramembrane serine protease [Alphaproteobacteria bacterium]
MTEKNKHEATTSKEKHLIGQKVSQIFPYLDKQTIQIFRFKGIIVVSCSLAYSCLCACQHNTIALIIGYIKFKNCDLETMNNKPEDRDENKDDGTIIHFPELEKRQKIAKRKQAEDKKRQKQAEKEHSQKEQGQKEKREEEYRNQYKKERSARANLQSNMARHSAANGKHPFINWHKIPPVSRVVVALFIIIHLAVTFLMDDAQRLSLYMDFGFVPAHYSGLLPLQWLDLISPLTTAFIHGGWMHLLTNCIMMMAMGVFFERQFGTRATLIYFVVCTLCGDLTYFILNPTTTTPVIGASGAISGLFAGVLMMMNASGMSGSYAKRRGPFPFILLWIVIMIGVGLISTDTAWQAHLGGFLGGLGLFQLWRKGKIRF